MRWPITADNPIDRAVQIRWAVNAMTQPGIARLGEEQKFYLSEESIDAIAELPVPGRFRLELEPTPNGWRTVFVLKDSQI